MHTMTGRDETTPQFLVVRCNRPGCGLRFTVEVGKQTEGVLRTNRCPACRAELETVAGTYARLTVDPGGAPAPGPELEVLLDNIRSAWNVGSMLRSCDGAGVRRVHLCGVTSLPDNPKVMKTSLGAEKSLPWDYAADGAAAAQQIKAGGLRLWALEGGLRASSLFDSADDLPGAPIVLVAGNEISGVDPGILDLCEKVVCLPMRGVKGSLNVAVAFGIAVYFMRFGRKV